MLIKLIFDVEGKIFWYKCREYQLEEDFYIFTDIVDGKRRKLHKSFFRGEEQL